MSKLALREVRTPQNLFALSRKKERVVGDKFHFNALESFSSDMGIYKKLSGSLRRQNSFDALQLMQGVPIGRFRIKNY
jgi:hypothetical protein